PSSGAAQFSAMGPSSEYPASSNTTARPRCDRPNPPHRVATCGARRSRLRASSFSSRLNSSDGPCGPWRASDSRGTITCRMKSAVRFAQRLQLGRKRKVDHDVSVSNDVCRFVLERPSAGDLVREIEDAVAQIPKMCKTL